MIRTVISDISATDGRTEFTHGVVGAAVGNTVGVSVGDIVGADVGETLCATGAAVLHGVNV